MIDTRANELSSADLRTVQECPDWPALYQIMGKKRAEPNQKPIIKALISQIQSLPRTLGNLHGSFIRAMNPHAVRSELLWGFMWLNVKVYNINLLSAVYWKS
jgi:hypothetical protein